jgi:hypothetical protein
MKRLVVRALAKVDQGLDEILYRPAIVKAFVWMPRWWRCDLAKLSIALDKRWHVNWWTVDNAWPGDLCEACRRRASIHVYGGLEHDDAQLGDFLESRPVQVCGWCRLDGPLGDEDDVQRELVLARDRSIAWRWR